MPTWRNKPVNRQYFNKRYPPHRQQELHNAAKTTTQRLYSDVLVLWRGCADKKCRRHLRCMGEPTACLRRGWQNASRRRQRSAYAEVVAGGPRQIAPANHKEWSMRRTPPSTILT